MIWESVLQVAAHVIGSDATITFCGQAGNFELNVMMPMMALRLLESIQFTANVVNMFTDKCVIGIAADRVRCAEMVEKSLAMVTALAPAIGYERAARLAQEAMASGQTVRQLAEKEKLLSAEELDRILDARRVTDPGIPE